MGAAPDRPAGDRADRRPGVEEAKATGTAEDAEGRACEIEADRRAKTGAAGANEEAAKPMQDEWGLYDPEQCGFAALLERLEELTETEAAEKEGEGRSAIMRR